jgi:virginiamycin B lyase
MWFTVFTDNLLGRITGAGDVTLYPAPTPMSQPYWLVLGPDGALWFTEINGNQLGRAQLGRTPGGLPRTGGPPAGAAGPDRIRPADS